MAAESRQSQVMEHPAAVQYVGRRCHVLVVVARLVTAARGVSARR
ncbi:hypothetical protein [Streptomyces sp. ME18-1-4]|nr:hypothetical protein [Streptomyces sp. ME18-1-4]MDX3245460.1 hypothetical protein [Streptomyces sp. ME18-1-4]